MKHTLTIPSRTKGEELEPYVYESGHCNACIPSATNFVLLFQVVVSTSTVLARRVVAQNPLSSSLGLKEPRSAMIAWQRDLRRRLKYINIVISREWCKTWRLLIRLTRINAVLVNGSCCFADLQLEAMHKQCQSFSHMRRCTSASQASRWSDKNDCVLNTYPTSRITML